MKKFDQLLLTVEAIRGLMEELVNQQQPQEIISKTDLLSAKEVQEIFGIVHSTYYRWLSRKWLQPVNIGGKHYYRKDSIQSLLESRRKRERGGH